MFWIDVWSASPDKNELMSPNERSGEEVAGGAAEAAVGDGAA